MQAGFNTCHEPVTSSNLLRPSRVVRSAGVTMSATNRGKLKEAYTSEENVIVSRSCDNPDCSNTVDSAHGSRALLADGIFCSSKCKEEFFLWGIAAAHCNAEISVSPRLTSETNAFARSKASDTNDSYTLMEFPLFQADPIRNRAFPGLLSVDCAMGFCMGLARARLHRQGAIAACQKHLGHTCKIVDPPPDEG